MITPSERVAVDRRATVAFSLVCTLLVFGFNAPADITGTITLTGKPNSKDETFYAPVRGCGDSPVRHTENWKIGPKGELADVILWIADPKFESPDKPVPPHPKIEVKQIGCRYIPHVIAIQASVPFAIVNGDPTLHNIRAKTSDGPGKPPGADVSGFNFGQVRQGQSDDKELDAAGLYSLQCDVHPWMQCWVMALKSPCFGVSGDDGTFKVWTGGLVDGAYKIEAWHPRFAQPLEQTVQVKNGIAVVNFQFDGAKSF